MTYRNTKLFAMMMATLLTASISANAANVTWSITDLDVDGTALDSSGTLLQGVNFVDSLSGNGGNSVDTTVNGIDFTGAVATTASGAYYTTTNISTTNTNQTSNVGSGDALYSLVYSAATTSSNSNDLLVNLQNLTIGNDYRVQFILSTSDFSRITSATSGGTSSSAEAYGSGSPLDLGAGLISAEFTADASSQVFELVAYVNIIYNSAPVQLSGFALHDTTTTTIPTPAALPAGLALLGLMIVRRRRR